MTRKYEKVSVGDTYGKLTVLSLAPRREGSAHLYWKCRCECGKSTAVRSSSLLGAKTASCGCYRKGSPARAAHALSRRSPASAWHQLWNNYKYGAARRGLPFELSQDAFQALCEQDCAYCGAAPVEDRSVYNAYKGTCPDGLFRIVFRNGVDRVDNQVGYVLPNCAPCCATCNIAKQGMSLSDFRAWVRRLHHGLFNNPLSLNKGNHVQTSSPVTWGQEPASAAV